MCRPPRDSADTHRNLRRTRNWHHGMCLPRYESKVLGMVRKLIDWATGSRAVVILMALGLLAGGLYAFFHVNVEAYPDPAPAIIEDRSPNIPARRRKKSSGW